MKLVTNFERYVQPILTKDECASTRGAIGVTARVAQVAFSLGFVITSLKALWNVGLMLTGGSFFFHGCFLTLNACQSVICHDLFRIGGNVASLSNSGLVSRLSQAYLGNVPKFITSLDQSSLKKACSDHLGSAGFASALTDKTLIVRWLNPEINNWLNEQTY